VRPGRKDEEDGAAVLRTTPLPPRRWTHVAIFHGVRGLSGHLDGKPVASTPAEAPLALDGAFWASRPGSEPAAASLADLRVHEQALETADIAALNRRPPAKALPPEL